MHGTFPLFNTPIDLAQHYWKQLVVFGDIVIDATCGNGKDTLILAQHALKQDAGAVYAFDIQDSAIDSTKKYLSNHLPQNICNRIHYVLGCHTSFPEEIKEDSVTLIVYNLGYLPGGDKNLTTSWENTLLSIDKGLALLKPGGVMSITCYPGHPAGKIEEDKIIEHLSSLDPKKWSFCYHTWGNRKHAPSLALIQKSK